jgi:hypothetical protein
VAFLLFNLKYQGLPRFTAIFWEIVYFVTTVPMLDFFQILTLYTVFNLSDRRSLIIPAEESPVTRD